MSGNVSETQLSPIVKCGRIIKNVASITNIASLVLIDNSVRGLLRLYHGHIGVALGQNLTPDETIALLVGQIARNVGILNSESLSTIDKGVQAFVDRQNLQVAVPPVAQPAPTFSTDLATVQQLISRAVDGPRPLPVSINLIQHQKPPTAPSRDNADPVVVWQAQVVKSQVANLGTPVPNHSNLLSLMSLSQKPSTAPAPLNSAHLPPHRVWSHSPTPPACLWPIASASSSSTRPPNNATKCKPTNYKRQRNDEDTDDEDYIPPNNNHEPSREMTLRKRTGKIDYCKKY